VAAAESVLLGWLVPDEASALKIAQVRFLSTPDQHAKIPHRNANEFVLIACPVHCCKTITQL